MGRIVAHVSDDLEEKLRKKTRKQGDLSKFVEEALKDWLEV